VVPPAAVWPKSADKDARSRIASGQFTPWFDLGAHAGKRLHGRLNRAGGVAEFPNVTAEFVCGVTNPSRHVVIELATAPEASAVVKRFDDSFNGGQTSFLVSPALRADAASLETASQMTARRLAWAREASGGRRTAQPTSGCKPNSGRPNVPNLMSKRPKYSGSSDLMSSAARVTRRWRGFRSMSPAAIIGLSSAPP